MNDARELIEDALFRYDSPDGDAVSGGLVLDVHLTRWLCAEYISPSAAFMPQAIVFPPKGRLFEVWMARECNRFMRPRCNRERLEMALLGEYAVWRMLTFAAERSRELIGMSPDYGRARWGRPDGGVDLWFGDMEFDVKTFDLWRLELKDLRKRTGYVEVDIHPDTKEASVLGWTTSSALQETKGHRGWSDPRVVGGPKFSMRQELTWRNSAPSLLVALIARSLTELTGSKSAQQLVKYLAHRAYVGALDRSGRLIRKVVACDGHIEATTTDGNEVREPY